MVKQILALLAGVSAVSFSAAGDGGDAVVKKELEKLSGTWEFVAAQRGGKDITKEMKAGYRITFRGDLWLTEFEGRRPFAEGDETIAVDPSKSPKEFLRVHKGVIGTGKEDRPFRIELPGIYEIDGDVMKLCWAVGGKGGRPKEFKTEPGSEHLLVTLKRVKAKE
jgi:uncharacterized protein (TIGR03067 family)